MSYRAAFAVLLAVALIAVATYELAGVLAFDWTAVPAAPEAPAVPVRLAR